MYQDNIDQLIRKSIKAHQELYKKKHLAAAKARAILLQSQKKQKITREDILRRLGLYV